MAYVPGLDGLRGWSVLSVLAFHGGLPAFGGGFLGVDVFFVLSGFLISALLIEEWEGTGTIDLPRFYARRALRLLPALLVFLVAWSLVAPHVLPQEQASEVLPGVIATLLYLSNVAWAYWGWSAPGLGHTWSLAMEEQFYLIWPFVFRAMLRAGASRGSLLARTLTIAALVALHRWWMWLNGAGWVRIYMGPDTRADALLIGCAAAFLISGWTGQPLHSRRWFAFVAQGVAGPALILAIAGPASWRRWEFPAGGFSLVALAAGTLVVFASGPGSRGSRVLLGCPLLIWIGRMSYGLYLWHYPVFLVVANSGLPLWATFPVQCVVSISVATISFLVIERPALRLKEHFKVRPPDRAL